VPRSADPPVPRAATRASTRLALALASAVAFGVAMSVFKGNGAGVRDEIGNLSAPWLLVPFFAAAAVPARRWPVAAAIGTVATCAALGAFYVANAFVLDLGPHGLLEDLRLAFATHWFLRGLVSGPVFGVLGARWRQRGFSYAGVAVTALLVAEPIFWALAARAGGVDAFAFEPSRAVSMVEVTAGLVACACMVAIHRRAALSRPRDPSSIR
jgi:hypothetical protein